jgi:hypothetical protein
VPWISPQDLDYSELIEENQSEDPQLCGLSASKYGKLSHQIPTEEATFMLDLPQPPVISMMSFILVFTATKSLALAELLMFIRCLSTHY